jgi:hypothetical protein
MPGEKGGHMSRRLFLEMVAATTAVPLAAGPGRRDPKSSSGPRRPSAVKCDTERLAAQEKKSQ